VPATCPYPEPARSSPTPTSHFLKIHLILSSHLRLGLPSGLLPSVFPTKILYTCLLSPIHATCPAHLILLNFITQTIWCVASNCNYLDYFFNVISSNSMLVLWNRPHQYPVKPFHFTIHNHPAVPFYAKYHLNPPLTALIFSVSTTPFVDDSLVQSNINKWGTVHH